MRMNPDDPHWQEEFALKYGGPFDIEKKYPDSPVGKYHKEKRADFDQRRAEADPEKLKRYDAFARKHHQRNLERGTIKR